MAFYKNKTFWYITIAALVFITDIAVYVYLKTTPSGATLSQQDFLTSDQSAPTDVEMGAQTVAEPESNSKWQEIAHSLAISNAPSAELDTIKNRAQSLSLDEILKLKSDSTNWILNQDKRFESVFLLAYNGQASLALKQIVEFPMPDSITARERDFEHILRAQAIEGLEMGFQKDVSKQIITELILKTNDTFLLDRLKRAQNTLDGMADSSEVQDNQQLKKILEN